MRPTRLAILALASAATAAGPARAEIDFNRDIKPILSENCYFCHGPDGGQRKAKLRLDRAAGSRKVVESGELVHRVTSTDPDEFMPPPEAKISLTERERELLKEWVAAGAPYDTHWAFVPPVRAELAGGRNPIDQIVARHHAKQGLKPRPRARPETLIRRISLDLTGLPPTPEQVAAFVADPSPEAYARVVDQLLASPAYGERLAWEWLDAARYADSNGYQGDNDRSMWPWRDWAIDAFNDNLPYDQFTIYQIAGDLLPGATFEQKLATGFLRNHAINGEGGRIAEENRVDYVMDMAETVGTVWLGLTLNCCRCHDHKFDPVAQREYYQLNAYLNQTPVNGGGGNARTPPVLAAPSKQQRAELEKIAGEMAAIEAQIAARETELANAPPAEAPSGAWQKLVPEHVEAQGQKLEVQPDAAVLASGDNPKNDTYTVRATTGFDQIAGVRLEALLHPSMTGGGLSRSDSGNFVLTGFEVSLQRPGEGAPQRLEIAAAEATFEQGSHKITTAFDGNPGIGWAVHEGRVVDREHAALFRFKEPVKAGEGSVLTFVLRHDSPHVSHNLGRFRLSVTADPNAPLDASAKPADSVIAELTGKRKELESRRGEINKSAPQVMVMEDMANPRKTYILDKGIYTKQLDEVSMGTPAALPPMPEGYPANRLGLAKWLVADENPLTARVTVNRFWQMLFGVGLVKTAEDFGTQGETPPMGDLLDHLAVEFREGGWDVKRLLKLIVTSETYQQSARADNYADDPENRLLARGARFRMPSWMLRDQALAAGGLLVDTVGGAPVKTYQPDGVWEEASFGKKRYSRDSGDALYRRSIYTFWRRIIAPPAFFDNAGRTACSVKPFRTNTPLHALYTLNDVTFVEAARVLAETAIKRHPEGSSERLELIYGRALARPPSEREAELLLAKLAQSRAAFEADPGAAGSFLANGERPRDESLNAAEHAAWTALTLAVFNLDEAVTKE